MTLDVTCPYCRVKVRLPVVDMDSGTVTLDTRRLRAHLEASHRLVRETDARGRDVS